jgi:hypothetical protein
LTDGLGLSATVPLLGPGDDKFEIDGLGVDVAENDEEKYVDGRMIDRGDLNVCARTCRIAGI